MFLLHETRVCKLLGYQKLCQLLKLITYPQNGMLTHCGTPFHKYQCNDSLQTKIKIRFEKKMRAQSKIGPVAVPQMLEIGLIFILSVQIRKKIGANESQHVSIGMTNPSMQTSLVQGCKSISQLVSVLDFGLSSLGSSPVHVPPGGEHALYCVLGKTLYSHSAFLSRSV